METFKKICSVKAKEVYYNHTTSIGGYSYLLGKKKAKKAYVMDELKSYLHFGSLSGSVKNKTIMKGGKRTGAGRPKGEPTRVLYKRVPSRLYKEIKEKLEELIKNLD